MAKKVLIYVAPPLTGKSTIGTGVQQRLGRKNLVLLDNEWSNSPEERCMKAALGPHELNSSEYAKSWGRAGQIAYQNLQRQIAKQGFDVLAMSPPQGFASSFGAGGTLWENVIRRSFDREYLDVAVFCHLLSPGPDTEPPHLGKMEGLKWDLLEQAVQERRVQRGKKADLPGEWQRALDADKQGPRYYREQIQKVIENAEPFGFPICWTPYTAKSAETTAFVTDFIREHCLL